MSIAGLGFRQAATPASLRAALEVALAVALAQSGRAVHLTALATAWDKADSSAFRQFAAALGLPVLALGAAALQHQPAQPRPRVPARYGQHSLAEAAALAAAGPGARLLVPRCVAPDGMATVAIALRIPENAA